MDSKVTELSNLVQCVLWYRPDLLKPEYKKIPNRHPLAGHCYVASEALHYLLSDEGIESKPMFVRVGGASHWYLKVDGHNVDPTRDQFGVVPYSEGIGKGFLTKNPSKRAQSVINIVKSMRKT